MSGAKDNIVLHDQVGMVLGCAKCGALVQSGQSHICKGEVQNGDKQAKGEVAQESNSAA